MRKVTPIRVRGATIDSSWRPVDTEVCVRSDRHITAQARLAETEVIVKLVLIAPLVVVGLTLSACGGSSSGSLGTAAPSLNGYEEPSANGMVKGSTSGNSAPLTIDEANKRAQDRCLELDAGVLPDLSPPPPSDYLRKETDPNFMVMKMPPFLIYFQCVGEKPSGASCTKSEFNQVAFQRAKVNGEAEVLRCSVGNGGLFWLRMEAYSGS